MLKKIRGTSDLFGIRAQTYHHIIDTFVQIVKTYNFTFIKTPTIELTNLFNRSIGGGTDIVKKEMYTFVDRKNQSLTLRPEGTAGIVRAFIENKMVNDLPQKYYYYGSMFRYERPQKGRQREFNQFGIESFGIKTYLHDGEIIMLAYQMLSALNIKDLKVLINSLGTKEDRNTYNQTLYQHFHLAIDEFCEDCQERLHTNPLRILDCKKDQNHQLIKNAPKLLDYINPDSKVYFDKILATLDKQNIPYQINHSLVRGLDYYSDTIFEIISTSPEIGSQATLVGGGRYDDLISLLDGPKNIPAIGFAFGIERLMLVLDTFKQPKIDYFIINLTRHTTHLWKIINFLRVNRKIVDFNSNFQSLKSSFKLSEKYNPDFLILLGDKENQDMLVTIKNNKTKTQKTISYENFQQLILGTKNE